MPSYISVITFPPQGCQASSCSLHRAAAFTRAAKKEGVRVSQLILTSGETDGAVVFEAKDDADATGHLLSLAALGHVHPETLRAFYAADYSAAVSMSILSSCLAS